LSDVSGVGFWTFWLRLPGPWPQRKGGYISLKFVLETRPESESFEPLINFVAFLVQKLWPKNKLISYLISGLINYFVVFMP